MEVDETSLGKKCTFHCFKCRLAEEIVLVGRPFEFIDFYCVMYDRFMDAVRLAQKNRVVLTPEQRNLNDLLAWVKLIKTHH